MMAFYRLLLLEVVITRYKGNIVISTVITRKQLVLQRAVDHDKSVISCYKDSDYQNLTSYGWLCRDDYSQQKTLEKVIMKHNQWLSFRNAMFPL